MSNPKYTPTSIGDFSRPLVEQPASPTEAALRKAEDQLDEASQRDEAALKPMTSYEDKLKEVGLTKNKASDIIDAVLIKGFYSEDIRITSKVKARFRTRNSRDTRRAQEILESQRISYDTHYNEVLSRLLLASSLEQFGNDKLSHPERKSSQEDIEKQFQERVAYVDSMPDPALRILMTQLAKFDRMVSTALSEGCVENF